MYKIEIHSIDSPFLSKVEKPLILNLNNDQLKDKAVVVSRQDCLLNQVLRLIQTYQSIDVAPKTKFMLDCARETQMYREILVDYEDTDKAIFTFGSTILDVTYDLQAGLKQIDKVLMKYFIKRGIRKPNLIIYLQMDYQDLISKRKKFPKRYNVEGSLKGKGAFARNKKMPLLLEKIKEKFAVDYAIINIGGKNMNEVTKEILEITKKYYNEKA